MTDDEEIQAARIRLYEADVRITLLGGEAPFQGEGSIGFHQSWYFRSRGDKWTFDVYATTRPYAVSNVLFKYQEDYGEWPEAGFISELQALQFIEKAVAAYYDSLVDTGRDS